MVSGKVLEYPILILYCGPVRAPSTVPCFPVPHLLSTMIIPSILRAPTGSTVRSPLALEPTHGRTLLGTLATLTCLRSSLTLRLSDLHETCHSYAKSQVQQLAEPWRRPPRLQFFSTFHLLILCEQAHHLAILKSRWSMAQRLAAAISLCVIGQRRTTQGRRKVWTGSGERQIHNVTFRLPKRLLPFQLMASDFENCRHYLHSCLVCIIVQFIILIHPRI